jgi:microcystin-dependent protein
MIPIHPCGTIMDVLRVGYSTPMRFWLDDQTLINVRWFRANPGAKVFPGDNSFVSSNWDSLPQFSPVGEDWPRVRNYDRGLNPLGYTGQSFCGDPDVWAHGAIRGVTPLIATDITGWAGCCGEEPQRQPTGAGLGVGAIQWADWLHRLGIGFQSAQGPYYPQYNPTGVGVGFSSDQYASYDQGGDLGVGLDLPGPQSQQYLQDNPFGVGLEFISDQEGDMPTIGDFKSSFSTSPGSGWLACDGSTVSQTTYAALYALLGATFGPAAGGTFTLPDFRGRVQVGAGTGPGLTARSPGDGGGAETVLLTAAESGVPAHSHPPGNGNTFFQAFSNGSAQFTVGSGSHLYDNPTATGLNTANPAISAHENMPPWLCGGHVFIYGGP